VIIYALKPSAFVWFECVSPRVFVRFVPLQPFASGHIQIFDIANLAFAFARIRLLSIWNYILPFSPVIFDMHDASEHDLDKFQCILEPILMLIQFFMETCDFFQQLEILAFLIPHSQSQFPPVRLISFHEGFVL
jgi:hypothetical protein